MSRDKKKKEKNFIPLTAFSKLEKIYLKNM